MADVLDWLSKATAPKTRITQDKPEPKEKLALQRSLVSAAQKDPTLKIKGVTDLISLINKKLEVESTSMGGA